MNTSQSLSSGLVNISVTSFRPTISHFTVQFFFIILKPEFQFLMHSIQDELVLSAESQWEIFLMLEFLH